MCVKIVSSKKEREGNKMKSTHYFVTVEEFKTLKVYENDHIYKALERAMVQQLGESIGKKLLEKCMTHTLQEITAQKLVDLMSAITIR